MVELCCLILEYILKNVIMLYINLMYTSCFIFFFFASDIIIYFIFILV